MSKWLQYLLVTAALLTPIAAAAFLLHAVFGGPSPADLRVEGDQLVAAIEEYHRQHGEYPRTLADAVDKPPKYEWRYRPPDLPYGQYFSLAAGDYGNDHFVLSYMNARGWYLDD